MPFVATKAMEYDARQLQPGDVIGLTCKRSLVTLGWAKWVDEPALEAARPAQPEPEPPKAEPAQVSIPLPAQPQPQQAHHGKKRGRRK